MTDQEEKAYIERLRSLASPVLLRSAPDKEGLFHYFTVGGMTKREAFAMAAIHGLAHYSHSESDISDWSSGVARSAVTLADVLIKELSK